MRPIDADALINEIKKETEKAIEQDDKVGSFWLGYIAGLVIKQPTIQSALDPETLIRTIETGITATNSNDAYSLGMRNGMRWCKSLIDGAEPKFEDDVMSVDDGKEFPTIQPEKAQLSKEGTTSDTISRQATLEAIEKMNIPENMCVFEILSHIEVEIATLPTIQPVATDTNVGDKISKFIDGLEEIFADLRERHVDDSVCGLCEYDGAYMGQSGDWCNECPGFDRDDCFKLSDETRKKWTDEIIKALSTIQPEVLACGNGELVAKPEPQWIPVSERLPEDLEEVNVTWVNHSPEPHYEFTKDKPFTATAVYYRGEWYWYSANCVDNLTEYGRCDWDKFSDVIEIIAWMPLPTPYTK